MVAVAVAVAVVGHWCMSLIAVAVAVANVNVNRVVEIWKWQDKEFPLLHLVGHAKSVPVHCTRGS